MAVTSADPRSGERAVRPVRSVTSPGRFWRTVLAYGGVYFVIMALGYVIVEPYAGGCMFIIPAYFMVLVVALPILSLQRFGSGMAVFLPFAVVGAVVDYYYERVVSQSLPSIWGVVGWSLTGLIVGLSGDLAHWLLPRSWNARRRAAGLGAVIGLMFYLTTLAALSWLYSGPSLQTHYWFFTRGIAFSLPWLVVNGAFAGYTAQAIARPPASVGQS